MSNDVTIRIGGLLRCCVETIKARTGEPPAEDEAMLCPHCRALIRYRGGAWEWAHDHKDAPR